jgi:hypothetical protein
MYVAEKAAAKLLFTNSTRPAMLGTYFPICTPSPLPLTFSTVFCFSAFSFYTLRPFFVFQPFVLLFFIFYPFFLSVTNVSCFPNCLFSCVFSFDSFPNFQLLCFVYFSHTFFIFNHLFLASHVHILLLQFPSLRLRSSFILAFSLYFLSCGVPYSHLSTEYITYT